jgi:predicted dehydrogenase
MDARQRELPLFLQVTTIDRTPMIKKLLPRVAVVGCGYWGKNHVLKMHDLGALAAVCEPSESGRALARQLAPDVPLYATPDELFVAFHGHPCGGLDGVVVATPAETHYAVTTRALRAGCDVLVEKPLALHVEEGEALVDQAERLGRILMVGHLLEYHPAILKLRQLIAEGALGAVRYVYSNRLNLGKIRREENILWSFAPHDIAIVLRLVGDLPFEVTATGGNYVQANIADVTVTHLLFNNGVRAHIFVSWLHPYKEQRLVVVGSRRMASFDDVAKELVLFDQRVEWQNGQPLPVAHGVTRIPYDADEPLRRECQVFLDSIRTRLPPLTDGASAQAVLEVLCAAQRSLVTHGHPVQLPIHARRFSGRGHLLPASTEANGSRPGSVVPPMEVLSHVGD